MACKGELVFNHFGYSQAVLAAENRRNLPTFTNIEGISLQSALVREWQSRIFTKNTKSIYRLSIALKDHALSEITQPNRLGMKTFSGVMYPSVALHLLEDNVAILPSEVDAKLELFEVILLVLSNISTITQDDHSVMTLKNFQCYDFARANSAGEPIWGQKSQVVLPEDTNASAQPMPRVLPPT